MIGASGAIAGVLGAYLILYPRAAWPALCPSYSSSRSSNPGHDLPVILVRLAIVLRLVGPAGHQRKRCGLVGARRRFCVWHVGRQYLCRATDILLISIANGSGHVAYYLVTGGAGFIGSNYVRRLLERGENVAIYDNLSRAGARVNLAWLEEMFGSNAFRLIVGDVTDAEHLAVSAREADVIVHLAGQVAVTTSVTNPRQDFEIECARHFQCLGSRAPLRT